MVTRGQVVAYRTAVHGLGDSGAGVPTALDVGAQDHPTGVTARLALALRGDTGDGDRVLVHSMRAATHLHRAADLGLLAAALRLDDGTELAKQSIGPFGQEIGADLGAGIDQVAAVMADVMSDGEPRTKGELSGAVSPRVDRRLAPWCGGCSVHHVQDALFRYATLQAGLAIDVESPKVFRFLPPVRFDRPDTDVARAELVRRFVHAAGPVKPAHLAAWLVLTPAAARQWWGLIGDELRKVAVDGRAAWILAADADLLDDPPPAAGLRLLGPYDPLTEVADRELLLPEAAHRRQVWVPAGNPGVILADGEIAGSWRRRSERESLTLSVTPFASLPAGWARAVSGDADVIGRFHGAREVRLELASAA